MTNCASGQITSTSPPDTGYELGPTDQTLREQCQAAADLLQFSGPCPAALPATNNPVRCEVPGAFREAIVEPKEGCALGEGFLLQPSGLQDLDLHHVIIEGQLDERDGCGVGEPGQSVDLGDLQGVLFSCSEAAGLHAGHTLLRFQSEDVFVSVSAHGHTELNERVVLAIAEAIEMVPPS
jgi:hypothetical protein